MIYLDSSALLKLIFEEPESRALETWLASQSDEPGVTSDLAQIEVTRACRRLDSTVLPQAQSLLSGFDLAPITRDIVDQAGLVGPPLVRSLDAIHLATALGLGQAISFFVAYDQRLQEAAQNEGLQVIAPSHDAP